MVWGCPAAARLHRVLSHVGQAPSSATADPVEVALAEALTKAALADAWDAVAALTAELRRGGRRGGKSTEPVRGASNS